MQKKCLTIIIFEIRFVFFVSIVVVSQLAIIDKCFQDFQVLVCQLGSQVEDQVQETFSLSDDLKQIEIENGGLPMLIVFKLVNFYSPGLY